MSKQSIAGFICVPLCIGAGVLVTWLRHRRQPLDENGMSGWFWGTTLLCVVASSLLCVFMGWD